MPTDVDTSGDEREHEPTIEEFQDFYLDAQARAARARDSLAEMNQARRQQADDVVAVINGLQSRLRTSETARIQVEDDLRRAQARVSEIENLYRHLGNNYNRLREMFDSIMHDVETAAPSTLGVDKRIAAMLVHNDLGYDERGQQPYAPTRRVSEFAASVFPESRPLPRAHAPHPNDIRGFRPDSHQPYADSHHSQYAPAPDGYHMQPQPAYRNER